MRRMNVALDLGKIDDFGIGTYIRNLVHHLARIDFDDTFFLLQGKTSNASALPTSENFKRITLRERKRGELDRGEVVRFLKRNAVDVCHFPHDEVPRRIPCRYMVTVHDCVNIIFPPETQPHWMATWRYQVKRRRLLGAQHVIAVSETTKRDVERLYGIPEHHITVIHNALDERLSRLQPTLDSRGVLERYQIQDPFLLYAGNVRPHKNITRLIEAFAVLRSELKDHPQYSRLKLLIIGDELAKHQALRRAVVISRVQSEVRFLGFVPYEFLKLFYQNAAAFVFPSLYEGFGLPPLEAMACGTPVLTSNTSSLPEVVGDAAVLVNPENVFEIARGIKQILCDENLRRQLIDRGFNQIKKFSWLMAAQKTLDLYRRAGC
jgi:glycosyltransferase involved in cell wall biosynthesis